MNFESELSKFRKWVFDKPKRDANATFQNWLIRAKGFQTQQDKKHPVQRGGTVRESEKSWLAEPQEGR